MPIEVNTPDKLEYVFYPALSGLFTFKVRAANDAHLALTSGPADSSQIFEIFLGGWSNTKSVIRKNRTKPDVVELNTPGILNAGEFRGFWVRWYDNVIAVGHEGETAAFMSWREEPALFPIDYVGVCTGWGARGSWLIDEDQCVAGFKPPSGSGTGCWVLGTNGTVPPQAMEGGIDGHEQLYVGRAVHEGALIPGKVHPSHGVCYIPWGGAEHPHNKYEVLCAGSGYWVPISGANIPPNALPAGETETFETLFIGRAVHNGSVVIGKVQPSHGNCYIPYDGLEIPYSEYEIFVTK